MKLKYLGYKHLIQLVSFSVFCLFVYSSSIGIVMAQKKPTSLKFDVDTDDKKICSESSIKDSQFCDYYDAYNAQGATAEQKKQARDEMIDLVTGQVDTYYKMRKDERKGKVKWFQTLLDFLEIGAATAISIMNGERAKTVVGIALNGFQGGRTAFNKNFDILQTQVLINKMNANRAEILAEIVGNKNKSVGNYSWYAAKKDLRRYLVAGTFNNALESLVDETGEEVAQAERNLRRVERRTITREITEEEDKRSADSFRILGELEEALKKEETKSKATKALRNIVGELMNDPMLKDFLEAKNKITSESEGVAIAKALRLLMRNLDTDGNEVLIKKVENTIIEKGENNGN